MKHFFTFCKSEAVTVRLVRTLVAGLGLTLLPRLALAQLTISSTSPVANARAATAAGPVAVTFNQAVTAGSTAALRVFSAQRGGLRSVGSGTTTASGSTVSFAPTYAFRPGETVQATVRTTATAAAGGATLATPRVLQFTAAAGGTGRGNFRPGTDVATAATPEVVAADFNNDGILDLADTGNGLSVRLGTGGALYGPAVTYAAANGSSFSLTAGDLDNDSDLDLVVPRSSGPITVLRNNGSGTFTALTDAATSGNDPRKAALGDIDGDGDLDMLVPVSAGGGAVGVYFGNGSGGFAAPVSYTGSVNSTYVVLGDVDNDGDLDYAVSDYNNARVVVRRNDGSGLFSGGSNVGVNAQPNGLVLGDVNGDGALDILTANEGASFLSVALNTNAGTGSFAAFTQVTVLTRTAGLALGDVDADGDLDVVASSGSGGTGFYTCFNNGSGSFGSAVNTAGVGPIFYFSLADLDNDGDLDLAGGYPGAGSIAVRLNQPPAPTLTSLSSASGLAGSSVITLTGTGFTGATGVGFNGTAATTFSVTNSTTATATVPAAAPPGSGTVTITTPSGISNGVAFFVTLPASTIGSFAPATGAAGTAVTFTGTNLNNITGVRFGTDALTTNFVSQSASSLTVRVPVVSGTGVITLTNGAGAAVATATAFTYTPTPYVGQLLATLSPAGPLDACQPRTLTATAARRGVVTGAGFDNGVNTVVVQADGKVLVGGSFSAYRGATTSKFIRLNADGSPDAGFATGTGFDGTVTSVAVQADGKVLVGGAFNLYNGTTANNLIRLNADGSRDAGFATGAGFDNYVTSVAVQADGKVLVGGTFADYNGTAASNLIRLNADGSPDAGFAIGTGFDSYVYTVAVQADGKVLVGGIFMNFNGTAATRLIRLNTDGSADAGFVIGTGFDNYVSTVAVQADGKMLVGGEFMSYNGTLSQNFLIRLNANGSRDAGFATGAGFNGGVASVTMQADGQVLVSGYFSTYQGAAALRLIRLNANGSPDAGFVTGTGFNNDVKTVAVQADGRVLAGGIFSIYQGAAAIRFAALNADGSSNALPTPVGGASFTFSPGGSTTNPLVTSTAGSYTAVASLGAETSAASNAVLLTACPTISSFAPASGPAGITVVITGTNLDLVTGVRFGTGALTTNFVSQSASSLTVRVPVAAATGVITLTNAASTNLATATAFTYTPTTYVGQLLATLSPAGPLDACQPRTLTATATRRGVVTGAGFNASVLSVAVQADGKVLVGGYFSTYQGAAALRLIRLNADGSPDAGFVTGTGFNNGVNSLAVQADGKVLVGGFFTAYNGTAANYLIRLNADGSPDATFATGTGFNNNVNSVAVQADGKVLVGGIFGSYQGAAVSSLIRLKADGSRDATFATGTGFNNQVNSVAVQADGRVLASGNFTAYNGTAANYLIRLNADGSPDATFATGAGFNGTVLGVAVQADGKVLTGGVFTTYQGASANYVARLNADGSPDATFATGSGSNNNVFGVAVQADGKVLVSGIFTAYNGTAANRLIRLNANGSPDVGFATGAGFNSTVLSVAVQADGRLLVGGSFSTYNGAAASSFMPLNADGSSNTLPTPVGGASFTFSPGGSTTNPLVTSTAGSYSAVASLGAETSAASNAVLLVACPIVSSFAPASGLAGTTVVITGTNLDLVTGVRFGTGTLTTNFVSQSATSLTVRVPVVASTGVITLTSSLAVVPTATAFTYTPRPAGLLAALSPAGPVDACQPRTLTATASSPAFATGAGFGGTVNSVVVQADGKVLAGGLFTTYQGTTANRLIRLNMDGSPDAGFALGAGFNSTVNSVAVQADGKVLVGGLFATYQGATANRLIRLNADGSPDATFVTGTGFSVAGSSVTSVAVQADGKVLVSGTFTTYQGATANRLIRLNADGSPDAGFAIGAGFNNTVNSVAVQADGKVLAGGTFTTYQGATANRLIRLNTDGSPDATFATGTGVNGIVSSVAVQADGKVLVGGLFTFYQSTTANRLIRLNANGSSDAGFATGAGFNNTVNSVVVQADGKVLVSGLFSTYQSTTANRLIRLNTNGSLDASFATGTGFSSTVTSVAVQADGQVLAGGAFTTYNGATANRLARLTATGSLNTTATAVSGTSFTFSPGSTTTNPLVTSAAGSYTAVASLNGETSAASNAVVLTACPAPVISSLSTPSGPVGTSVTITGSNLAFASSVSFNGTAQPTISANTATTLTVVVPAGATTGNLTVTTNGGTSNGLAFTVTTAPTVTTAAPTALASTSATLGGNATADGGSAVIERGVVYVPGTGTPTTADTKVVIGSGLGSFSQIVIGLTASTQYTTRAYATNGVGTDYGANATFTTTAPLGGTTVVTNVSCFGLTHGTINLTPSGGRAPYSFVWNGSGITSEDRTGLSAGTYSVVITDAAGATATVTATVSQPAAALALTGSQTNVSVSGGTDGTATVTATGGTPGYTYNWSPGNPSGDGTATVTGLMAGTYSVLVTDANSCSTSRSYTITQPGTAAPVVTAPANVGLTNDNTPTYAGTGPAGSTITVVVDGTSIGTTTATTGGTWSLTQPTALADGTHTVNATATAGGSTSAGSNTNGFTVDTVRPTVAITSTGNTTGGSTGTSPIAFTVTFSKGVIGFTAGDATVTGGTLSGFSGASGGTAYTFNVTPTGNGTVTVNVPARVAQDAAGNLNTAAPQFTIIYTQPVTAAPVVTAPAHVSLVNDNTPTYAGTAPAGSTVTVFVDGTPIGTATATGSGTWTLTQPTALADGTHTVNATAQTSGQAVSGPSNTNGFTVDATAPTALLTSPAGSSGGTTTTSPIPFAVTFAENVTGLTPAGLTVTNGTASNLSGSGTSYTFEVTPTAAGLVTVRVAGNAAQDAAGNGNDVGATYSLTYNLPDVFISTGAAGSPVSIAAGTYNNVTVTGNGFGQLSGAVTVNGAVLVQGNLDTNCQTLTGAASFTLAAGATLGICDAGGISATGSTGAVQVSGVRSFSSAANYRYNGTLAQMTGTGLPATVRTLTTTNARTLTLTQPVAVAQVLTVGSSGNLLLNGQALLLPSSASGTALVVNAGTGVVSGTATVQRYIDGSLNPGLGYRHFSAPVSNTTVADLATAGFTPVLTQSYNTSAMPGTTTPFPNVFGYNQTRLMTASNSNFPAFDKGFFVPQATDALTPGQGYAVNVSASPLVDFQGTLGNGDLTQSLARNAGATAPDAGWALVGNPYPAPLDWSQVAATDRPNLDAAVYVVQSTGPYTGGYRAYVNGQSTTSTNNPLLATAQGFWVRVSPGQTGGTLTFRNSQRVTDYATAQQTTFQRGTADPRPVLRLTLAGAGLADGWVAYAEAGATPGFDKEYDAAKLPNGHGLNLSSTGSGPLAIDGRPAFTLATVLPLAVGVPAAGSYTLTATGLANLPAGLTAYLRDAQTGQTLALAAGTRYGFAMTAGQAQSPLPGRFTVQFAPAAPLSATSAALAAAVRVYPNPAREQATVAVPGLAGTPAVRVELLNALGQVVLRQQAPLPAGGTQLVLPTAGLATGVYVVRLLAGPLVVTRRLTLE